MFRVRGVVKANLWVQIPLGTQHQIQPTVIFQSHSIFLTHLPA